MKKSNHLFYFVISIILMVVMSCQQESFGPEERDTPSNHTFKRDINDFVDQPNDKRVVYPTIVQKTFTSRYEHFAHTICKTWRITWPVYHSSISEDKIATAFSINNGALNSFDYLNNVDPLTTYNTHFSLYFDQNIKQTIDMWQHLTHVAYPGLLNMETTQFILTGLPLDTIEYMVKVRPSLFESFWPGGGVYQLNYNEGDMILFRNMTQNLYGGIRIVSIKPRIIEVYLAVKKQ
jgi:hypothetical protein